MNELESEKVFELLERHYNLNEANALCRCIFNEDLKFGDFWNYIDRIDYINRLDKTDDPEYIGWLESL